MDCINCPCQEVVEDTNGELHTICTLTDSEMFLKEVSIVWDRCEHDREIEIFADAKNHGECYECKHNECGENKGSPCLECIYGYGDVEDNWEWDHN